MFVVDNTSHSTASIHWWSVRRRPRPSIILHLWNCVYIHWILHSASTTEHSYTLNLFVDLFNAVQLSYTVVRTLSEAMSCCHVRNSCASWYLLQNKRKENHFLCQFRPWCNLICNSQEINAGGSAECSAFVCPIYTTWTWWQNRHDDTRNIGSTVVFSRDKLWHAQAHVARMWYDVWQQWSKLYTFRCHICLA